MSALEVVVVLFLLLMFLALIVGSIFACLPTQVLKDLEEKYFHKKQPPAPGDDE